MPRGRPKKSSKKSDSNKKTQKSSEKQNKIQIEQFQEYEQQLQKCGICLQQLGQHMATLNCGHSFCSQLCARGWWRQNQHCPYCRQIIQYIQNINEQLIFREQIPQKSQADDQEYIPQCYQCRADIQQNDNIFICTDCSTRVVHESCIPFKDKHWMCFQCSQNYIDGKVILPIIKYNPILHYLFFRHHKSI